ncbi:MAG: T9SS type A sorting domain-containing protein [Saprospiraceae bacterium]
MLKSIVLVFLSIATLNMYGQSPTWSGEIANLVYKNCTSCHHSGGIAPFSLMTYNSTFIERFGIRSSVQEKIMPPWPPDNNYRRHGFNRALSESAINAFVSWVNAGAPSGDLSKAPAAPVYDNMGFITNPDLIITMPKYTVTSEVDEYRCFPDSTQLGKDMWMTEFECIPGDPSIVHHVLVFRDKGTKSYSLDAKEPGPGYVCFGGAGTNDAELLGAWVPGSGPFTLPKGFGMKLPAHSNIIIQVHYPAGSKGMTDQTRVKFKLTDQPQREAYLVPALNHEINLTNGPMVIPANSVKTFNEQFFLPFDASLIGVAPHMHLLGQSIKTWAVAPGNVTIPLIDIPEWDFHWQGVYQFPMIQYLPAGTFLYSKAVYDNTTNNPENPNTPPKQVTSGEATTDEMMITYFLFTLYQAGDEKIVIDSTQAITTTIKSRDAGGNLLTISPNPSSGENVQIEFVSNANESVRIQVYDVQGRKVFEDRKNYITGGKQLMSLASDKYIRGLYLVKLEGTNWAAAGKWIKQ